MTQEVQRAGARLAAEPAVVPAVGGPAPDFELANQFGEPVRLSELRGRNVVVLFYPFAFSGICTGELCEIRDNLALFEAADATVLAVSVDSKFAQRAYAEKEGYDF
ncbi:MAG TPA: redoxin domain-containing protein, partial [Arthrobacter sp.]|nr:redoxin domain-containing protein [Arthrobacter sp.]